MKVLLPIFTSLVLFLACQNADKQDQVKTNSSGSNVDSITSNEEQNSEVVAHSNELSALNIDSIDIPKISLRYDDISTKHISSLNGISYKLDIGFGRGSSGELKRKDLFYHASGSETTIYDSWLEYGFMNGVHPCSPICDTSLYVYTSNDVYPLNPTELVRDSQDVCGNKLPLVTVKHDELPPNSLFISTMFVPTQSSFIPVQSRITDHIPEWLKTAEMKAPKNCINKEVEFFQFSADSESYIATVRALGWLESIDVDKYGPSKNVIWEGIYYITKKQSLLLTPVDLQIRKYYGNNFKLRGFQDINGDGYLDIIIGDPVSLILESTTRGFRSYGFPFFPPGGC